MQRPAGTWRWWLSSDWPSLVRQKHLYHHHRRHILLDLQWATLVSHAGEAKALPVTWLMVFGQPRDTSPVSSHPHCYVPISQGSPVCFFFSSVFCSFSEHYCLSSFSQAQWLIILLIVWRRITTGPPSYKKRKISLIPDYLSPWQETIFESCFLVQSPLC